MNITIVYDSVFGNTAQVAKAIAAALEPGNIVRLATVQEARQIDLAGTDLLIVGSPTRGFRPTPMIAEYVEGLSLRAGTRAAAFDTRIDLETVHPVPLRWVVDAGGYAATRIANSFDHHGFAAAGEPAGFIVLGTEGPLKDGEIERAQGWAKSLAA